MQKLRVIFVFTAVIMAFAILGVSLSSVSLVQSAGISLSMDKELYFNSEILPDHIAYPILMGIDRARLESVPLAERIYLQTEYANKRLWYAKQLLEKDKPELALATITKAQKYMLGAAQEVRNEDFSDEAITQHVTETLAFHIKATDELDEYFSESQLAVIDRLKNECQVVYEQLTS